MGLEIVAYSEKKHREILAADLYDDAEARQWLDLSGDQASQLLPTGERNDAYSVILVALNDGVVAGVGRADFYSISGRGNLTAVYTRPDHRHAGVGTRLARALIERLEADWPCTHGIIATTIQGAPSARMLEASGEFRLVGTLRGWAIRGTQCLDMSFWIRKRGAASE